MISQRLMMISPLDKILYTGSMVAASISQYGAIGYKQGTGGSLTPTNYGSDTIYSISSYPAGGTVDYVTYVVVYLVGQNQPQSKIQVLELLNSDIGYLYLDQTHPEFSFDPTSDFNTSAWSWIVSHNPTMPPPIFSVGNTYNFNMTS